LCDHFTPKKTTAWTCQDNVDLKYQDMDLFDPTYDIDLYTIAEDKVKLELELESKKQCLVLRIDLYVDHKDRQTKYQARGQQGLHEDLDIEDIEEIEEIEDIEDIYVSIYTINNDTKTLSQDKCFQICNTQLDKIKSIIEANAKTSDVNNPACVLIEKVSGNKIVPMNKYPYDTLFFIGDGEKQQIVGVNNRPESA
jgi:hypothetical protein